MAPRRALVIAPRFVIFGAVCAAWLGAMTLFPGSRAFQAAGRAWFLNWGIQILIVVTSWLRPFSLPERYYRPVTTRPLRRSTRLFGVRFFGRLAHRIHPLWFDPRAPNALAAALDAAETTHVTTCTIVAALAIAFALRDDAALALFLTLWNVLFNLYPVVFQRLNRARLQRFVTRRRRTQRAC